MSTKSLVNKYKAIMFDVDGTLVKYDYSALPTDLVVETIQKSLKHITVCLVTGRSYFFLQPVLNKLGLNDSYVVINNGAQVVDLKNNNLLYDEQISIPDAQEIVKILNKEKITFYLKQEVFGSSYIDKPFNTVSKLKSPYMFFTAEEYSLEKVEEVFKKLSQLKDISLTKAHHKNPNKYGFIICHVNATKLHGIHTISRILNLKKEEIIGVGDSYNDFPLLMACGLKIAMGNAVEDLKAIADFVAPPVEEDGAAYVLEKFILKT